MKHWMKYIVLMLMVSMGACSSEEIDSEEQTVIDNKEIKEFIAEIGTFQTEGLGSRTVINMGESSIDKPVWADKDTIGIYPTKGDQLSFPIVEGVGKSTCSFDGGGWALKTSTTYTAYSPFNRAYYYADNSKLPVSMLGQEQTGNDNSSHLGKYDLQIAKGSTPESGVVKFSFNHQICFVRMDLVSPITTTWKSITLQSDAKFTTEATMDLTLETPTLTSTTTSNQMTLDLENVKTEVGETITAYMAVLPIDLTGKTLTVTLTDMDDNEFTKDAVIANDYRNFKAGYARWISVNDFPNGTIDIPYVTFTADAPQSFAMSKAVSTLEYSLNGGEWKELGTNTVIFGGDNGNLRIRGKNTYGTNGSEISFGNATPVSCSGDIRTLLDYENYATVSTNYAKYSYLFYDCYQLTSSPELPATNLISYCYSSMFSGCRNLINAPELPATTLAPNCYYKMFYGCSSLTEAPDLPAISLEEGCYSNMFYGCSSLQETPQLPATTLAPDCYYQMFRECTNLTKASQLPAMILTPRCYSTMFYDCSSLKKAPELPAITLKESCYSNMFGNCSSLTEAPDLPATTLVAYCYDHMFGGCSSLTIAPQLPATILAEGCYYYMFSRCSSLTEAPDLPTTTLAAYCYRGMFWRCISLTKPPQLPATTLAEQCYLEMFQECSSLTKAPQLPATTLAETCYSWMFYGCSSLIEAPQLPATTLADECYRLMFYGCSSLIEAPQLPATTLAKECYDNMFSRCSNLKSITMLATDISASDCLDNWMYGVASSGTFTKAASMTSLPSGSSGIPAGWTVVDYTE